MLTGKDNEQTSTQVSKENKIYNVKQYKNSLDQYTLTTKQKRERENRERSLELKGKDVEVKGRSAGQRNHLTECTFRGND